MQEEIEHKTVNLAISTTKLSARTLLRGMQFLLRQYDKHASQGKQSMKRLLLLPAIQHKLPKRYHHTKKSVLSVSLLLNLHNQ